MNTQKLKARLEADLSQLLATESQAEAAADTVELDQSKVGRLSRMDALQQQAMSQEQNRRRAKQAERIKAALGRLESGDYGYCLACDEAINPKRLAVDPATPFCIRCADQQQ